MRSEFTVGTSLLVSSCFGLSVGLDGSYKPLVGRRQCFTDACVFFCACHPHSHTQQHLNVLDTVRGLLLLLFLSFLLLWILKFSTDDDDEDEESQLFCCFGLHLVFTAITLFCWCLGEKTFLSNRDFDI